MNHTVFLKFCTRVYKMGWTQIFISLLVSFCNVFSMPNRYMDFTAHDCTEKFDFTAHLIVEEIIKPSYWSTFSIAPSSGGKQCFIGSFVLQKMDEPSPALLQIQQTFSSDGGLNIIPPQASIQLSLSRR